MLYLVATPIGNLQDITLRALETLRAVDYVASEDTRKTGRQSVAVVSDAGTPGIADPGFTLVRQAIDRGLSYTMIPGPSALIMAVVLSGLPTHSFTFRGFPPRKQGKRQRFLQLDQDSPHTLVFYESPYRIRAFLADALLVYGDRDAAMGNELTKMYEAMQHGRISELLTSFGDQEPRGEYVVVIASTRDDS
jgi:16S rRNA (cytidine1402-2'-O)-methyltransferase